VHPDVHPEVPDAQDLPGQEPGVRHARAVPYELEVRGELNASRGLLSIQFINTGRVAAVFQVRAIDGRAPWTYTVGRGDQTSDTWDVHANGGNEYDLSVYGQNGFFRSFKGSVAGSDKANLSTRTSYDRAGGITLEVVNHGSRSVNLRIADVYTRQTLTRPLAAGRTFVWHWSLSTSYGWYDLTVSVDSDPTFRQQLAGHVETGRDSMSDPLLGV
jgi:phospholipase C